MLLAYASVTFFARSSYRGPGCSSIRAVNYPESLGTPVRLQ